MIRCHDLTLAYGDRQVLTGFTAGCGEETITAIIGANGSGKSTLLAALAGDLAPISGELLLQGKPLSGYSAKELSHLRAVAVQSHHYWMSFQTAEILRLGHDDVSQSRIDYIVGKLNLASFLDQPVTTLSGGQLQRVEIARALMRELPLILLDEPFASQDLASIESIKELLIEEKAAGRTVVLVAHARGEELTWCDQVIEIKAR